MSNLKFTMAVQTDNVPYWNEANRIVDLSSTKSQIKTLRKNIIFKAQSLQRLALKKKLKNFFFSSSVFNFKISKCIVLVHTTFAHLSLSLFNYLFRINPKPSICYFVHIEILHSISNEINRRNRLIWIFLWLNLQSYHITVCPPYHFMFAKRPN